MSSHTKNHQPYLPTKSGQKIQWQTLQLILPLLQFDPDSQNIIWFWNDKSALWRSFYYTEDICLIHTYNFNKREQSNITKSGNPNWNGSICTIGLLVQIKSLLLKKYVFIFHKPSYLNKEVNCTEQSPSVRVPWQKGWSWLRLDLTTLTKTKRFSCSWHKQVDINKSNSQMIYLMFQKFSYTWHYLKNGILNTF
jgi:hypothetical protein